MSSSNRGEKTRKVRVKQKAQTRFKPYGPHKSTATGHRTSAKPLQKKKGNEHLTTGDWLLVFSVVDEHPDWDQQEVVEYFSNRKEGILRFTQSTLSRRLKPEARAKVEEDAKKNPNALSAKRARVVTRPDVERALWIWQQGMESQNQPVTGHMLVEMRRRVEDKLGVPLEERMNGNGWVASFKKT